MTSQTSSKQSDVMDQYCYSPLLQDIGRIRLLRLLPCEDQQADLRCELFEYTLRESDVAYQPYEALSYVWGTKVKPQSIIIDQQRLPITENLCAALRRLRSGELPRLIWADAVCINQDDDKEKERQIRFLPVVYAKASCVLVWLGEAKDGSDRALEVIRMLGEKSMQPSDMSPSHDSSVQQLLNRPWFRRIWVGNYY